MLCSLANEPITGCSAARGQAGKYKGLDLEGGSASHEEKQGSGGGVAHFVVGKI